MHIAIPTSTVLYETMSIARPQLSDVSCRVGSLNAINIDRVHERRGIEYRCYVMSVV